MSGMIWIDGLGNVKRLISTCAPLTGTALDGNITIKQVSGAAVISRSVSPPFTLNDLGIPPAPTARRRDSS